MSRNTLISYILSALAVVLVLKFNLLPTVLAGLAVHVVTCRLANLLPIKREGIAKEAAVISLAIGVVANFIAAGFGLVLGNEGLSRVWRTYVSFCRDAGKSQTIAAKQYL